MKFTVTKKDINNGYPGSDRKCPIALSMSRKLQAPVKVRGRYAKAFYPTPTGVRSFRYHMPEKALCFMIRFDDGGRVKPFSFTCEAEKTLCSVKEIVS
jgi:hypothetical protein